MANKIPVGDTIAKSYNFVIEDFLSILGVVWFPAAILTAAFYFLSGRMIDAIQKISDVSDPFQVFQLIPFVGLLYLIVLLLFVMQYVGITELALGLRSKRTFVYFSLGKAFWLVIAAWILVWLLLIVIEIGLVLVAGLTAGIGAAITAAIVNARGQSDTIAGLAAIVSGVMVIAVYCAFFYVWVRLTYLVTPAVIAERKIAIGSSWSLSRGNFWRIVVVWIAVTMPAMMLLGIVEFAILFPVLTESVMKMAKHLSQKNSSPEELMQIYARTIVEVGTMAHTYWYVLFPLGLVVSAIYSGLTGGARAFAYRALVPLEKAEKPVAG